MINNISCISKYKQVSNEFQDKSRLSGFYAWDFLYKMLFRKKYISEIYNNHVISDYKNCAFCVNLDRSPKNKSMLCCLSSKNLEQTHLLPDILFIDNSIPWLYRKPCAKFERLNKKNYLRNFSFSFNEITVRNFEYLEALTYGFSCGEKPCYICASVNHTIYKECYFKEGYNTNKPCKIISNRIREHLTGTP